MAVVAYVKSFSSLKDPSDLRILTGTTTTHHIQYLSNCIFSNKFIILRAANTNSISARRKKTTVSAAIMLPNNPIASDISATLISGAIASATIFVFELTAKYQIFDSKLNRKLVHTSIGLVFMLCWPLFSSGYRGAVLASLVPGVNIIRVLLIGLGIYKDDALVKSMSRFGDHRELLKGPLYYASTITFACIVFWRTSPIGMAAICNLCAGDGLADIVGRRLGKHKLPYNQNKSYAGTIAMAIAGFVASVGYMHYFSMFGFMEQSSDLVLRFLIVSLISALVESLPISTELDDNLTVPLASFLAGGFLF
ncbi:unnamed protein product [Amaranthus hypochondriacus]